MTHETLNVVVHFMGAVKPFTDHDASPTETVGSLKKRAMTAFGLADGTLPDGNSVTYHLYFEKREPGPNETLGALAGNGRALQFDLVQKLTQG